jgi:hypothetical protein
MSTHQDAPRTFHKYDSDDRKILVDLLQEYSSKLLELSGKIVKEKNTKEITMILYPVFFGICTALFSTLPSLKIRLIFLLLTSCL